MNFFSVYLRRPLYDFYLSISFPHAIVGPAEGLQSLSVSLSLSLLSQYVLGIKLNTKTIQIGFLGKVGEWSMQLADAFGMDVRRHYRRVDEHEVRF